MRTALQDFARTGARPDRLSDRPGFGVQWRTGEYAPNVPGQKRGYRKPGHPC
jgi:hypothetical protein